MSGEQIEDQGSSLAEFGTIQDAVKVFRMMMESRLFQKHDQGFRGWDDPAFLPIYRRKLIECAARVYAGDSAQCVDLANWAMIIDYCESKKAGAAT